MLNKYEFISLANRMLYEAVKAVAADLGYYADEDMIEAAYTASIVTKFPELMNKRRNGAKFGGCFIHQSPYVKMNVVKGRNQCEVGDLLCICKKTVNGRKRLNAALFQLKKDKSQNGSVKPDNARQRRLYTEWPIFSFVQDLHFTGENHYDIQSKTVTSGAQYMFINKHPYPNECHCDCYGMFDYPVVYTHSIPEAVMENNSCLSFGLFLWDFIHWQNGRSFSDSIELAKDDWSRLIWELIERSKTKVFNINKGKGIHEQRYQGDTIGFLTNLVSYDFHYNEWISQNSKRSADGYKIIREEYIESDRCRVEKECDGISILFIDLDSIKVEIKKE